MAGIFPNSGVEASQALNTVPDGTYPLAEGCLPRWASTSRCQPRYDPVADNAMRSEILNLITCFGDEYDCNALDNLCRVMTRVNAELFFPIIAFEATNEVDELNNAFATDRTYNAGWVVRENINGEFPFAASVLSSSEIGINETGFYRLEGFIIMSTATNNVTVPNQSDQRMRVINTIGQVVLHPVHQRITEVISSGVATRDLQTSSSIVLLEAGETLRMIYNIGTEPNSAWTSHRILGARLTLTRFPTKYY